MSIVTLGLTDKAAEQVPRHLLPYAKTQVGSDRVHRLLYHLLDVGQMALVLWRRVLATAARRQLARSLALDETEAGRFLAFIAALHDLGKASPAYQAKYAPPSLRSNLAAAGLRLSGYSLTTMQAPHGVVSTWALQRLLPDELGLERRFAKKLARAVGGHHGAWPAPYATDGLSDDAEWADVRARLFADVRAVFAPVAPVAAPPRAEMSAFLTWFSGLVSVADWLGSIDDYEGEPFFPFEDEVVPAADYTRRAVAQAEHALRRLGWLGWQARGQPATFGEMFPEIEQPRPIQEAVIAAGPAVQPPALLILEAPTGIGKTEAALYLADTWLQAGGGSGIYVAMPTMATSNQMFDRTRRFLASRYPDDLVNLHLLHSQAAWDGPLGALRLSSIDDEETGQGRVAAMAWFNQQKKRALLAPFGVGTVDQSLLAVLQTKHFFVRLFGLAHKVIIFDEVHAYDTYMNTLFHRLLAWLGQIGTSVIVLSATLPNATRRALVAAYTGQPDTPADAPYPALTLAAAGRAAEVRPLPAPQDDPLALDWSLGRVPEEIAMYLAQELAGGGCAAVVCNTVRRAQEVYRALQTAAVVPPKDLILFHARFPPVRRETIESDVLARFGKERPDNRPARAVVVATQVIEQSLDLDFDVMITDLAPVDLLLQRAGRLHRHDRPARPPLPRRLTICRPDERDGVPMFTKGDVYDAWLLHRTYALLRGRDAIALPSETRPLIEGVYDAAIAGDVGAAWQAAIDAARQDMEGGERAASFKAAVALVAAPAEDVLGQANVALQEDNPGVHHAFQARTRDIDPGVSLVCLHRRGEQMTLDAAAGSPAVDLSRAPNRDTVRELLRRTITIHNRGVVFRLLDETLPAAWQEASALRHHRLALFENGEYAPPGANFRLRLGDELGLEVLFEEAQ